MVATSNLMSCGCKWTVGGFWALNGLEVLPRRHSRHHGNIGRGLRWLHSQKSYKFYRNGWLVFKNKLLLLPVGIGALHNSAEQAGIRMLRCQQLQSPKTQCFRAWNGNISAKHHRELSGKSPKTNPRSHGPWKTETEALSPISQVRSSKLMSPLLFCQGQRCSSGVRTVCICWSLPVACG